MSEPWVPTVNDLRVKLCYICREEEQYDNPQEPPVVWVHPCKCTLIAHESCLLSWIQSAQQDAARKKKALKCPQCGASYELESDNPPILKILNIANGALSVAGKVITVSGIVGTLVMCSFGLYVVLTSYGSYAIREFLGHEMYTLLLTDDPSNWPWHAYINLPLIPISLILSRTKYVDTAPLIPLFFCWTTTAAHPTVANWRLLSRKPLESYPFQPIITWPPSPLMVTILFPFVEGFYRRMMKRFRQWVLGAQADEAQPLRRIELALNEGGPLNMQIAANFDPANEDIEEDGAAPPANGNDEIGQQEGADAPQDPAAVAEQTIRITGSSLGRFVGGALLVPRIANFMGSVLYQLSRHSLLLRKFLALRGPLAPGSVRDWTFPVSSVITTHNVWAQLGLGLRVGLNVLFGGTKTWHDADPVWWRNSIGLGIFILAKDCISILHLRLTKREIETRRVKSRSFAGIDLKELDLINPPP